MKTRSIFNKSFLGLAFFGSLMLVSCEKETEDGPTQSSTATMGDPKSTGSGGSRCLEITNFIDDGQNETSDFANFKFEFFNNGDVIARNPNQEFHGQWALGFDDGVQKLFLNFNGTTPDLNELTEDWRVISLGANPSFQDGNGPNASVLQFALSTCDPSGEVDPALAAFNENLVGDAWTISNLVDNGQNETFEFNNTSFTFNEDGSVIAQRNAQSRTGQWLSTIDNSQIELIINFNGPALLNDL
ncbi:MAG: hypothetical protein WBG42_06250, partial [Cryomorphaceae bacterium]